MLDIKYVRENLDDVQAAINNRNGSFDKEKFSNLDINRRKFISVEEELSAKRNAASKSIGMLMGQGKKEEAEQAKEEVRKINEELEQAKAKREAADAELKDFVMAIPNMPHPTTPIGKDENDNPEVRK